MLETNCGKLIRMNVQLCSQGERRDIVGVIILVARYPLELRLLWKPVELFMESREYVKVCVHDHGSGGSRIFVHLI